MILCWNLLALATTILAAAICNPPDNTPTVDLGYAKYRGVRLNAGVDQYLGMRFAQPPVGALRFRAPEDPTPSNDTQDASKFGPICVGTNQMPGSDIGEDCLFVNVFKPSNATPDSKLPVWLFIQGGGYSNNANNNFNGTDLVAKSNQNIVFVNFNYRVGALGFLAGQAVRDNGDLNAGLLDQRKVMHWVKDNIDQFGGDPNRVIIHGVSAGAGSVAIHLTAYGAKKDNDLFIGAAPQSAFWPTLRSVSEMEFQYTRLLNHTSCTTIDCLRGVDIRTFMSVTRNEPFPNAASNDPIPLWYWLPVVDGDLIVDNLYRQFEQGNFIRVPMLVGNDNDEGTYFGSNSGSQDEVNTFLRNNYPGLTSSQLQDINRLYPKMSPLPRHREWFPTAAAAYGDSTFTCPGSFLASSTARYLDQNKSWYYRFNVQDPDALADGLGTPHVFELPAVFGAGNAGGYPPSYSNINAPIIPITMHYYISFIRSLNPNTYRHSTAPVWDAWGQGNGKRIRLETNNTAMEALPDDLIKKCDLWKRLARETQQ